MSVRGIEGSVDNTTRLFVAAGALVHGLLSAAYRAAVLARTLVRGTDGEIVITSDGIDQIITSLFKEAWMRSQGVINPLRRLSCQDGTRDRRNAPRRPRWHSICQGTRLLGLFWLESKGGIRAMECFDGMLLASSLDHLAPALVPVLAAWRHRLFANFSRNPGTVVYWRIPVSGRIQAVFV